MEGYGWWLIGAIVAGIIFGAFSWNLAETKGYNGRSAFWLGFFFSAIALLYYVGMPVSDEKREKEMEKLIAAFKEVDVNPDSSSKSNKPDGDISIEKIEKNEEVETNKPYVPSGTRNGEIAARIPIGEGADLCKCSLCERLQRIDRKVCYHCGATFE